MKNVSFTLFFSHFTGTGKFTWWRHQMETFSALLAICAGNSPVPGEFPTQRPVTRSFDVYFDLRPDKRLSKQSWGWWFETLSHSLWRHRNDKTTAPVLVRFWWIWVFCRNFTVLMRLRYCSFALKHQQVFLKYITYVVKIKSITEPITWNIYFSRRFIIYRWLSMVLTNQGILNICYIFSHLLRHCLEWN